MSAEGASVENQAEYAKNGIVDVISYDGEPTDRYGHAYFTTSPRVSADLIELIRNGTAP